MKSKLNLCLSWLMSLNGAAVIFFFFEAAIEFKFKRRKTFLLFSVKSPAFT